MPPPAKPSMYHFQGNKPQGRGGHIHGRGRQSGGNRRHEFKFRKSFPKAYERDLLNYQQTTSEEQAFSAHTANRFRDTEDLTDSDEAEMDDSDEDRDDGSRRAKRQRIDTSDADADAEVDALAQSSLKWSNPDPYTSLAPPAETTGKRVDVVKLIRKARNSSANDSADLNADQADFISLSFDEPPTASDVEGALQSGVFQTGTIIEPSQGQVIGKRKRTEDNRLMGRAGAQFHASGIVLEQWRVAPGVPSAPWHRGAATDAASVALHKEVIDFFHWVRPRDYEFAVREGVIQRLSRALNKMESGQLKAFGSYAAGLFLPVGDMDLVYIIHAKSRMMNIPLSKSTYWRYARHLERTKVARLGSVTVIPSAKVPIIKFVDDVTGLKVDLSFNNDTGVVANETFQRWKQTYPAMPILVSVIKQYLMIRGLNDVSVGGLGGFSTICLVTSFIQHYPQDKSSDLGEMLVEFFNLYGNLFERQTVAIRLDPPSYVDKYSYKPMVFNKEKGDRLTIIDPNRPDNNISGGSREIERIFQSFAAAHDMLKTRLQQYEDGKQPISLLDDLVGGNFTAYDRQRDILYRLHSNTTSGPAPAIIPPPPPPIGRDQLPPPPPPPDGPKFSKKAKRAESEKTTGQPTPAPAETKSGRRLTRFRQHRPDLASELRNKKVISLADALRIGGYTSAESMDKDFAFRSKRQEHLITS